MIPSDSPPRVTQRDIAKRLGVSNATISLALRNSPNIPESTRRRIHSVAEEMGYRINTAGSRLAHFKRNAVAPVVKASLAWVRFWPGRDRPCYQELEAWWLGAQAAAEKLGYHLEEFICDDEHSPKRLESILRARGVEGLIIAPSGGDRMPDHIACEKWGSDFPWERFSVVKIGRWPPGFRAHLVTADHVSNMMMALRETRRRGYDRIGLVISPGYRWGVRFEGGYFAEQQRLKPALRLPVLYLPEVQSPAARDALQKWLRTNKPEAILTDIAELPAELRRAGYRIPQDFGAAAMSVRDGNLDAGMEQNSREIGRVAVLTLLSLIWDNCTGSPAVPREVLIAGSWVDGESLPDRTV